jgi:predicted enzyme related to lactoylglutathione lyase
MASGLKTIIYPVKDIAAAKLRFSALLGAEPYIDQPYYVAFNAGGQDVGLDPNGHAKGMTGPVPYWYDDSIESGVQRLVDAGGEAVTPVSDVGNGGLIAMIKDADGNLIGLMQDAPAS